MGSQRYHEELVDRAYRQVIGSDKCREFFDLVEKEAEYGFKRTVGEIDVLGYVTGEIVVYAEIKSSSNHLKKARKQVERFLETGVFDDRFCEAEYFSAGDVENGEVESFFEQVVEKYKEKVRIDE